MSNTDRKNGAVDKPRSGVLSQKGRDNWDNITWTQKTLWNKPKRKENKPSK